METAEQKPLSTLGRRALAALETLRIVDTKEPPPRVAAGADGAVLLRYRDRIEVRDRTGTRTYAVRPVHGQPRFGLGWPHELGVVTAADPWSSIAHYRSRRSADRALDDLARNLGMRASPTRWITIAVVALVGLVVLRAVGATVFAGGATAPVQQTQVLPLLPQQMPFEAPAGGLEGPDAAAPLSGAVADDPAACEPGG